MIVDKQDRPEAEYIEIDLSGPQGNAFYLLAVASKLASPDEKAQVLADMQSGDYENLLAVFEEHFGESVILYR